MSDPRELYQKLKAQVAAGEGLTAREWDWFDARMKEWEPNEYTDRRKRAAVKIALEYFEKHLAPEGYRLITPDGNSHPSVEQIAEGIWQTTMAAMCDGPSEPVDRSSADRSAQ